MTRHDIIDRLRAALDAGGGASPEIKVLEQAPDGSLTIESGGRRFSLAVRAVDTDGAGLELGSKPSYANSLSDFVRSLDDAEAEAERYGCIPVEEVIETLDEARARGLLRRERRMRNFEPINVPYGR